MAICRGLLIVFACSFVAMPKVWAANILYKDYAVSKVYRGPTHFPQFAGRDKAFRSFRTRIRDGLKAGPKFAGEFSVVQFGCGTGCSFVVIASNRTGKVYSFPRGGEDNLYLQLAFQLGSRLLKAQWANSESCSIEYFEWDQGQAKLLQKRRLA